MKKLTVIFLSIICIVLCIASCGNDKDKYVSKYIEDYKYDGSSLIGVWQEVNFKDDSYQLYKFRDDGSVDCVVYSFGIEMARMNATYKVENDNTLVISWPGSNTPDRNKFSINNDKCLVICQVMDSETFEMELVPYNLTYNIGGEELIGTWQSVSDPSESFSFYNDHTGVSRGTGVSYDFEYATNDSYVFISFEIVEGIKNPADAMKYKVEGDTLTLTGQNENKQEIILTFTRAK